MPKQFSSTTSHGPNHVEEHLIKRALTGALERTATEGRYDYEAAARLLAARLVRTHRLLGRLHDQAKSTLTIFEDARGDLTRP